MLVEVGEALVVRVLGEGAVPHGDEHGGERRATVLRDDHVEAVLETRLVERCAGLQRAGITGAHGHARGEERASGQPAERSPIAHEASPRKHGTAKGGKPKMPGGARRVQPAHP